jgi:hypothetical protein
MHTVGTVYEVDSLYMSTSAIQPRETGIRDGSILVAYVSSSLRGLNVSDQTEMSVLQLAP